MGTGNLIFLLAFKVLKMKIVEFANSIALYEAAHKEHHNMF